MKRQLWVLITVLFCIISCASNPMPQENSDFQKQTGISLTFAKRGLFSLTREYNDEGYNEFFKKLMNNEIVFTVNETQKEWAIFNEENALISISVNNLYKKYNQETNNALLTSTIYSIGLLRLGFSYGIIEERFYEVINIYKNSGYNVDSLLNDTLFKEGRFKIIDNGIAY